MYCCEIVQFCCLWWHCQQYDRARELIAAAESDIREISYKLAKILHWEILKVDLLQCIDGDAACTDVTCLDLSSRCRACLVSAHRENCEPSVLSSEIYMTLPVNCHLCCLLRFTWHCPLIACILVTLMIAIGGYWVQYSNTMWFLIIKFTWQLRLSWPGWLVTYQRAHPNMVTHPTTTGLLQRGLVRRSGICCSYATRTECRCAPHHWHSTQRAHHSRISWHVALTACHSAHWLQDCTDDLQLYPCYESSLL